MNIVWGVADLLRKAPPPPSPGGGAGSAPAPASSFPGGILNDTPTPRVVFSDSPEEAALNELWKKYENAFDKVERDKSLQIFILQFVETFRDWGPQPIEQLVGQELGSDEVVGCSRGHPSKVILILIQEISLITSTILESGNRLESHTNHDSEQPINLGLSTQILHVLECSAILTRSLHNCRAFSYYGGVQKITSLLKELLRVIQRLNLKEHCNGLSLHFLTLCTLQSTVSGTRAQNHLRSIGGLEILLDGVGLPSSKFSVLKHSSISRNERGEILQLQIQYLHILSEAVFANVNNLKFLCENGRVHKFANCFCWPAFMIQKFHRQKDNTKASHALDSASGPICFLDITEWNDYSVKLSNALCSFILPLKNIEYDSIPLAYLEHSMRWIIRILMTVFLCIRACTSESELPNHIKIFSKTLQYYMIRMFKRVLISTPALLPTFREEGVWDLIFSGNFFYFGSSVEDIHFHIVTDIKNCDINSNRISIDSESLYCTDVNIIQVEAISFLEFAATLNENTYNTPECSALLDALEHCIYDPSTVNTLLKCFRVILQLATEQTLASFESLDVITRVLKVACHEAQELQNFSNFVCSNVMITEDGSHLKSIEDRTENTLICIELALSLFREYVTISTNGRILVLHNASCIECLFDLFQEQNLRKRVLEQILALFRLPSSSAQDHTAKLQLCSKYLENFARANEKEKVDSELLIDLLVSMREIIMMDRTYYQNLFCNGGCFLHIVSLLNGSLNEVTAGHLVLNVLETLTLLLKGNDASKGAFRLLVGAGYQTLQSLILDFYKWSPTERLFDALLSMMVDCKFELNEKTTIKNEDAAVLLLNILQKSSTSLQHYGLVILQQLLKQSITNRTSCFRAGLLSFLLDWFSIEEKDDTVIEIAEIIQILGAHSICGKDIRKIFALLRCEKIGAKQKQTSLLLTSLSHMLKEKGPEAFFEFNGHDSGIEIKSPFLWPYNRGLSFSCWLRVENFPDNGMMGLFSFFTDDGKGCSAVLNRSALVYEVIAIFFPILNQIKFFKKFTNNLLGLCVLLYATWILSLIMYAKVNEVMTRCTIGTELMPVGEEPISIGFEKTFAFTGQMGPVYVFSDALSSEQVKGIYFLGPSYMYAFHGDDSLYRGILDARDGLSSKIIFGFNAQATDGRSLFSVSSALDNADKSTLEAAIMGGTKLCSRHLPQDIIYCVGGVSVFFPLFTQFFDAATDVLHSCHTSVHNDKLATEVIELVATVLDGNVSNQQQMYLLSGLPILGFLLQSATPQCLTTKTLSALKYMFDILRNCGPSKLPQKDPNIEVASLGQKPCGLVESVNAPAPEKVATIVSGGIGTTLGVKMNRFAEKTITSREEIIPRLFFHLVILYLCKAESENASKCVLQFMSLLPILLISEDDQSKNKLHFLIWSLLIVRSQYGQLDDGARFHVCSHLILETIIYGKSMLVPNILGTDDSTEFNNNKEAGFILSFIQKDRVLAAAANEVKHMKVVQAYRLKKLQELQLKLNENSAKETRLVQAIEDEIHFTVTAALSIDDSRKAASQLAFREDQQMITDKWIHISRALMDERGPWSANPFSNDVVTHWKLDKIEDRWRRRFKLKRNYKFDEHLCQPSQSRNESIGPSADQPYISAKISEKMKRFLHKGVRGITDDSGYRPFEDTSNVSESSQSNPLENQNMNNATDSSDYHATIHDKKEPSSANGDNDYTKVLCSVRCVLVTPKRKLAGYLDITRTVMHFSFEFLVEGTGGSSVFNKFKDKKDSYCKNELGGVDRLDGMIESNGVLMQNQSNKIKRHRRWNITKIKGVHWTRYLLQYTAMEIFFDDSSAPIFLNFSSQKDTKNAGTLLVSLRNEALFPKGSTKDKNSINSFVDRRVALEMAENAKERWKRREISNFEYLVILNTLAGRSYNDLTQYPIFPWVLADYTSEKLDFNKSSTFRDLSKPVGALDENRFKVFEDRYLSFCDPDIPSFYYGSHYSSMGIVLHYMLRLEPFTTLHLSFQGGKFDHADRLFQSIGSAYRNSLSSTSDVKELIPEFFYMPEFLENSNSYHLGVKQDGEPIGNVVLPPWAKGSPDEFIHINREALESEYVSSNLHHWIDLIFGYKQRGQPAVEAANIFYYVTYEGAVDLENMDDMLQKSAIEDQIANFGQTPIQIFRIKHPRRGPPIPIAHPLYFAPQSIILTSSVARTISHMCAVLFIGLLENTIVLMNEGLILSVKMWSTTQLQSGGNFTYFGPQEYSFEISSDVISPRKIGTFLAENVSFGRHCLATMRNNGDNYLILCGNWENSFQIISLSDGRIMQSIRQHKDVVGCVAVSSDGNVVATGGYDTTVMIWHAFRGRPIDKKLRTTNFELSEKEHVIVERPVHILCGHDDIITCLFVSTELDIVISGSKDGTCIFHTLREGRYVRSIQHPSGVGLSKLVASQHGRVVLYSEKDLSLHMYSINGRHISSSATSGRLNCMELSCCGEFIVCAGEKGQIVLRSMHSLNVVWRYDGAGKIITSLVVTPEECIIAGTKDGSLLVFSIETPLLRRGSMQRNRIKPSTSG
ncbi:unnamed protein product [Urochloa decumbens]|uniref:BEACH domain-containing protein lvsC n=1 Tax=Urochloa decumbens TaxID=240449 RepID=A0ABC9DMC9_9POAL